MKKFLSLFMAITMLLACMAFVSCNDNTPDEGESSQNIEETFDNVAVAAGRAHTVALKKNGTVVAVGFGDYGQCDVSSWSDITAIAAGGNHTVGLKSDGTVVAVGDNSYGQCNVSSWNSIVDIAAGMTFTAGLKSDGTVVVTEYEGAPAVDVSSWSGITDLCASCGYVDLIGIKNDGTVVSTFADDTFAEWTDIIAVSASMHHAVGVRSDGTAVAVGGFYGEGASNECNVSEWTDIVDVATIGLNTFGLKKDGTVVHAGNGRYTFDEDWKDIVAIDGMEGHIVALTKNGKVLAKGDDASGKTYVNDWNVAESGN